MEGSPAFGRVTFTLPALGNSILEDRKAPCPSPTLARAAFPPEPPKGREQTLPFSHP